MFRHIARFHDRLMAVLRYWRTPPAATIVADGGVGLRHERCGTTTYLSSEVVHLYCPECRVFIIAEEEERIAAERAWPDAHTRKAPRPDLRLV